jgi:DNA-binding transcriptional MerR regulator
MDSFRIPNKKYFKDTEVAKIVSVSKRVIFFWETKIPLFSPEINSLNEKLYSRDELLLFLKVKDLIMGENRSFEEVYEILKTDKDNKKRESKLMNESEKSIIQEIKKEILEILTILKK